MPPSFRIFSVCLPAAILLSACGPDYIVNETSEIPGSQWGYADSIRFEIDIPDTARIYNLWLTLDHSPEFEWQNLYVRIHTLFPDGKRLSSPLSLELADKGGAWQGHCNRKRCRFRIPIQEGAYFQIPGRYAFTIEQYMRQSPVNGLQRWHFQIEDTGKMRDQ